MDINETLSQYSDWCYGISVGAYVVAMLFYLYEQAFGHKERVTARKGELVTVGGGGTDEVSGEVTDEVSGDPEKPARGARAERIGKLAVSLTVFGVVLHFAALALRGLATHRAPWGNMYEFGATLCLVAVVTWLVVLRRYPVRHLGV